MISVTKMSYVLLVDDHPIVRVGFATLLQQLEENIECLEADDAIEAKRLASEHQPAVAIVDLSLAGITSLDLIRDLRMIVPEIAILVISMHDEKLYAERALRAGAKGYIMKHHASKSVVRAIKTIRAGKVWLSDEMQGLLFERLADPVMDNLHGSLSALSNRELEVFRLIGLGLKKADICQQLKLSPNTVETHRANLKRKLNISSGAELYRSAFLIFHTEKPT